MRRVALVTGGTRGIGLAIARELQRQDCVVAAIYNDDEDAAVRARAAGFFAVRADVRDRAACDAAVALVESDLGPIAVLVNNAGITRDTMFHKMTQAQWHDVISVNLHGTFNATRAVVPGMRERRNGRIISISSVNGQRGQIGQANYAASKAALIGFTRSLALETARTGVTANVVVPGYIQTEMTAAMEPEVLSGIIAQIPVGRIGSPEDVARCVGFLAAPDAGFITGSCLTVNGGQHMAG